MVRALQLLAAACTVLAAGGTRVSEALAALGRGGRGEQPAPPVPDAPAAADQGSGHVSGLTTGEVRFADPESAERALQLNGTLFDGYPLSVTADASSTDHTRVIVGGLPAQLPYFELRNFFAGCGEVRHADVKSNVPATAVVRFDSAELAQRALELNGTMIQGHEIVVQLFPFSPDGTKVRIFNLPPDFAWFALKDFMAEYGFDHVYCEVSQGFLTAEVRYEDAAAAHFAVQTLHGSLWRGAALSVGLDATSRDGTRVFVGGLPPGASWQDLKDHFGQFGKVAFVSVDKGRDQGSVPGRGMRGGPLGEIRFSDAAHAQMAREKLDGTFLNGAQIMVGLDHSSPDATKLWVRGLSPWTRWQQLKDHFSIVGPVVFANIK